MKRWLGAWGLALGVALAGPAAAQEFGVAQSPILTIDQDRLYAGSAFGQRARDELAADSSALAAENRRIESELIAEEEALTQQRPDLPPEEFRALADAFDEKVQRIRDEQDAKSRALARRDEAERQRFYSQIVGILGGLLRERGAVAIIERRSIFIAVEAIDITDAAIARIDATLGDGSDLPEDTAAPDGAAPETSGPAPETAPADGDGGAQ